VSGGTGVGMAAPSIPLDIGSRDLGTGETTALGSENESSAAGAEDAFGLDAVFRRRMLPAVRFLFERYWRVEVSGARHVPADGPALLVANHSGALPFDGVMIVTAVEMFCGRTVRFLYDRFVENIPPVASFYRKVGGAVASRENAVKLLDAGELVLIFPEGVSGVAKPFGDRYHLRPFGPGFARLAIATDAPIVPLAVVGAEEIYPLVGRAEGVVKRLGVPYVPITPFFPLLGLLGTLPLPTKWFMHFGKSMRIPPTEAEGRWQRARLESRRMRRTIQSMVMRLRARRRSVFFG
jgi:1-acyl-sn-glycerol-3-phosphate acyltransferase